MFPEANVKGCLFHYTQAIQRNIARHGLEPVYERRAPFDGPEFAAIHRWTRRLVGMAVSPVRFHRVVWNNCLTNPPHTGDNLVDANLIAFRDYYVNQWLSGLEQALLWNHYDRNGPRTTNHAEGYHRGLSGVFDTRRRLPLGIFLGKLQELHHDIRQRVKQLQRGAPPTARSPKYVQNDANLQMAKETLEQWLENVYAPLPDENMLRNRLLRHLDRVQHLIG